MKATRCKVWWVFDRRESLVLLPAFNCPQISGFTFTLVIDVQLAGFPWRPWRVFNTSGTSFLPHRLLAISVGDKCGITFCSHFLRSLKWLWPALQNFSSSASKYEVSLFWGRENNFSFAFSSENVLWLSSSGQGSAWESVSPYSLSLTWTLTLSSLLGTEFFSSFCRWHLSMFVHFFWGRELSFSWDFITIRPLG